MWLFDKIKSLFGWGKNTALSGDNALRYLLECYLVGGNPLGEELEEFCESESRTLQREALDEISKLFRKRKTEEEFTAVLRDCCCHYFIDTSTGLFVYLRSFLSAKLEFGDLTPNHVQLIIDVDECLARIKDRVNRVVLVSHGATTKMIRNEQVSELDKKLAEITCQFKSVQCLAEWAASLAHAGERTNGELVRKMLDEARQEFEELEIQYREIDRELMKSFKPSGR